MHPFRRSSLAALWCLVLAAPNARGQNTTQLDSLRRRAAVTTDTAKVTALAALADALGTVETGAALAHAQAALALAERLGSDPSRLRALIAVGNGYRVQGRHPEALPRFEQAQALAERLGDERSQMIVALRLSSLFGVAGEFDRAAAHAQRAHDLAARLGDYGTAHQALNNLGNVARHRDRYAEALALYARARAAATAAGDARGPMLYALSTGAVYDDMGDRATAIQRFLEGLTLAERLGDRNAASTTLYNLGLLHIAEGDGRRALDYLQRARAAFDALGNRQGAARVLLGEGGVHLSQRAYAAAEARFRRALELARAGRYTFEQGKAQAKLGETLAARGRPAEALAQLREAAALETRMGSRDQVSYIDRVLSAVHLDLGRTADGLRYAREALRIAEEVGGAELRAEAHDALATAHAAAGGYRDAYHHRGRHVALRDSVFTAERAKILADAEVRYDVARKDMEIERLNQAATIQRLTNARQGALLALAGVVLLAAVAVAGAFYNRARLKQRANRLLDERRAQVERQKAELEGANASIAAQNRELERLSAVARDSLAVKEVLLKEVHHRVKNNLQIVASLLGMQLGTVGEPRARAAVRGVQSRVEAMALVHQKLYQSEGLDRVDVQDYLDQLVDSLYQTFDTSGGRVAWAVDAAGVSFDPETAVPLGLIVTELISNAFKYAFTERAAGAVRVEVRPVGGGAYELRVEDDGIGIPASVRAGAAGSLGLVLVHDLTRQLGGAIRVGVPAGAASGTAWSVRFTPSARGADGEHSTAVPSDVAAGA